MCPARYRDRNNLSDTLSTTVYLVFVEMVCPAHYRDRDDLSVTLSITVYLVFTVSRDGVSSPL